MKNKKTKLTLIGLMLVNCVFLSYLIHPKFAILLGIIFTTVFLAYWIWNFTGLDD